MYSYLSNKRTCQLIDFQKEMMVKRFEQKRVAWGIYMCLYFKSVKPSYIELTFAWGIYISGAGTGGARGATGPPNVWQIS